MFRLFLSSQTLLYFCLTCSNATGHAETSGFTQFRFVDGLIWVEVDLNPGGESLQFVVDTGAGKSVIDLQAARESGIRLGSKVGVLGVGGSARAHRVKRFSASLAGVNLPNQVLALDLSAVSAHCHQRLDGLIGIDFFKDRLVQFDFDSRQIRMGSASLPPDTGSVAIPLTPVNDAWCALMEIQGNPPQPFRIDTGFDGGVKWWPGSHARENDSAIGSDSESMDVADVSIKLGSIEIGGLEVTRLDRHLFEAESGLLGNAFLSRFQITISLPENKMFLQTGKASQPDFAIHQLN